MKKKIITTTTIEEFQIEEIQGIPQEKPLGKKTTTETVILDGSCLIDYEREKESNYKKN